MQQSESRRRRDSSSSAHSYKSRKGDITFDAFQTEELLIRCMETIDRLVTIAFLTQPLKTEVLTNRTASTMWFYVVTVLLLDGERRLDIFAT